MVERTAALFFRLHSEAAAARAAQGRAANRESLASDDPVRWNEPLSPLVPRREREQEGSDGGCIKMPRVAAAPCQVT